MHEVMNSFKYVGLCCLFLDSHLATCHSTIRVQLIYGNKLGWLTLGTRKHYHDFLYSERCIATCGTHASDRWWSTYQHIDPPTHLSFYFHIHSLFINKFAIVLANCQNEAIHVAHQCRVKSNYSNSCDQSKMSLNDGGNTFNELMQSYRIIWW